MWIKKRCLILIFIVKYLNWLKYDQLLGEITLVLVYIQSKYFISKALLKIIYVFKIETAHSLFI